MLVPGEPVRVGAPLEQQARRVDVPEEAREPERLEAVVAEGVGAGGFLVEQLPQAFGAPERGGLEDLQLELLREQLRHPVVVPAIQSFEQLCHLVLRAGRGWLAQEPRKPAVLEQAAPGLALRAVVDRVLLEVDAGDRRAADVAGLAELVVDAVAFASFAPRSRSSRPRWSSASHRVREASGPVRGQSLGRGERRQAAPCAGSRSPRRGRSRRRSRWSRRSECSRRGSRGEDLAQALRAEAERLRAEVRELRLGRLGREQPDAGALLRAGLGEHELRLRPRTRAGTRASSAPSSPARR